MPNQNTSLNTSTQEPQQELIPQEVMHYVDNRGLVGVMIIIILEVATPLGMVFPTDAIVFWWWMYFASKGTSIWLIMLLFSIAVILWDLLWYRWWKLLSPKIHTMQDTRYFKKKYITICEQYFEDYGHKTMIISKFLPIRSMLPLVAGVLLKPFWRFLLESIISSVLWILSLLWASYFIIWLIPAAANHIGLLTFLFVVVPQIVSVWYMILPGIKKYEAKLWAAKENFQHIAQEIGVIWSQFQSIGHEIKEIYQKVIKNPDENQGAGANDGSVLSEWLSSDVVVSSWETIVQSSVDNNTVDIVHDSIIESSDAPVVVSSSNTIDAVDNPVVGQ